MDHLVSLVKEHSRPDDLILAMGAGDVNSLWSRLSPLDAVMSTCWNHIAVS